MSDRCVVFSGGGVAGIAWLLGVVTALRDAGVELAEADVLIGTSAGSAVATQLATGSLEHAAAQQQLDETTERAVEFDAETFFALVSDAVASAGSAQEAARRVANVPLQQDQIGAAERRAIVAARLPVQTWPDRELRICAVAQDTGERVVFDRSGTVSLVDAVAASCAVPGVWPPVGVDGRHYVDGGAHSLSNADLAAGAVRTLILVPAVLNDQQKALLDTERRALEPGRSLVVAADEESVTAFGPNPLDPSRRPDAFRAGRRQGIESVSFVAQFWRN